MKALPFHIHKAWERYPFWVVPHRMTRRKTLTPRFSDFEKKIRLFCGLQLSRNKSTPSPSFARTPRQRICQCPVIVTCEPSLSIRRFWGKRERWKRKRERAEGEKRLTQMLLLEPSTPTQHDSICWMVLCQAFLSLLPLPASPSKISSPLAP